MRELMISLMMWLTVHSGGDLPMAEVPEVWFASQAELQDGWVATGGSKARPVLAFYDQATETVWLNEQSDPQTSIGDRSLLLHELVHHMQWNGSKREYRCEEEKEREAYLLQIDYLRLYDLEMEDVGLSSLYAMVISTCPEDLGMGIHPDDMPR